EGDRAMSSRVTHPTRREAIAGLAALSLAGCGESSGRTAVASTAAPTPTTEPGLNALAQRTGRRWGSAISWNDGNGGGSIQNPAYAAIIRAECGVVVPENEMKWRWTRPGPDRFDFTRLDEIVAWARGAGLAVRGHTLLWHRPRWFPDWLNSYDYGANPVAEAERL